MSSLALELKDVVKRYRKQVALDHLDITVPTGSVFGLVGRNGAGKTTAMSIAGGIVRATSGKVDILGAGAFDAGKHAGRLALMPQDASLPLYAKVRDLLVFYALLQGMDSKAAERNSTEVLEWVNLADRADSTIRSLSHGMRRRVVIAQAFLGDPELVLLDEPLSGLDPKEVANVRNMLIERKGRQTIVVSSHNLHEIERVCDYVGFLEKGKAVQQASMEAITRTKDTLTYILSSDDLPMARLEEAVPDFSLVVQDTGDVGTTVLRCEYNSDKIDVSEVNKKLLSYLLDAGVGVIEVQRGSRLENEYLNRVASAE
jgi:ABC-2 type transport system ATP-binding protein